jgi:hypothetical protein
VQSSRHEPVGSVSEEAVPSLATARSRAGSGTLLSGRTTVTPLEKEDAVPSFTPAQARAGSGALQVVGPHTSNGPRMRCPRCPGTEPGTAGARSSPDECDDWEKSAEHGMCAAGAELGARLEPELATQGRRARRVRSGCLVPVLSLPSQSVIPSEADRCRSRQFVRRCVAVSGVCVQCVSASVQLPPPFRSHFGPRSRPGLRRP